jgi:hypothetical protein
MTGDGCDKSNIEQLDLKSLMDLKPRKKTPERSLKFSSWRCSKGFTGIIHSGICWDALAIYLGLYGFVWFYMDLDGFLLDCMG